MPSRAGGPTLPELSWLLVPKVLASLALLSLAFWMIYLEPRSQVHRAFALMAFLVGGSIGISLYARTALDYADRVVHYFEIAIPFAVAWFAVAYLRRYHATAPMGRALARRPVGVVLLVVALFFELMYVRDPSLFWSPQTPRSPFVLFWPAAFIAFALVAILFAREFAQSSDPVHRRAMFLSSAGFAMASISLPAFQFATTVAYPVAGTLPGYPPAGDALFWTEQALYVVAAVLGIAAVVFLNLGRATTAAPRFLLAVVVGELAIAVGLGLWFPFTLGPGPEAAAAARKVLLYQAFTGRLFFLMMPLLTTAAIVRHRLFDIDVKLRFAVRQGTVISVFVAVFFLVGESAAVLFGQFFSAFRDPNTSTYLGIVAAGFLIFALAPLQNWAERLSRRVAPHAKSLTEMTDDERSQLYREQVQLAWLDGTMQTKERLLLDRLRDRLDIPLDLATHIEDQVVRQAFHGKPKKRRPRAAPA